MSISRTDLADFGREVGVRANRNLGLAVSTCLLFGAIAQAQAEVPLWDPVVVHAYRPNFESFAPWGSGSYGYAGRYDTSVTDIYSDYYGDSEDDAKKSSIDPDSCAGNPIIYSTGNKVEQEVDFFSSQEEMPLHLTRTYNAYSRYSERSPYNYSSPARLFRGWLSSFDYSILDISDPYGPHYLEARRPDGSLFRLHPKVSGRWETSARPNLPPYVIINPDGSYVLHNEDMSVETYKADGYIAEIKNKNGIKWAFTYYSGSTKLQKVTHSSGRNVEFFWTGDLLTSVKDPAGNIYSYSYADTPQYGSNTVLSTVTLPGDSPTTIALSSRAPDFFFSDWEIY